MTDDLMSELIKLVKSGISDVLLRRFAILRNLYKEGKLSSKDWPEKRKI